MHQVKCDIHGGEVVEVEGLRTLPIGWARISIACGSVSVGGTAKYIQTLHKDLCPNCIEGIWGKEEISKETANEKFVRYITDYLADLASEAVDDAMENA